MHVCEMCLSHIIHYQRASVAVAVVIRAVRKVARSPNGLLNSMSEPLSVKGLIHPKLNCAV